MTATVHSLEAKRQGVVSLKLYAPRWYQRKLHRTASRFSVWVCHRRFGKTVATVNELIRELVLLAASGRERCRAGYVAPFYRQAKRIAWDYVRLYTSPIPGMKYLESELSAVFPWGARLNLYGADNPDSMRGEYFDAVALDEVAQMSPRVWSEVLRPALADREGRAIFIGTPCGRRNLFHRLYEHAGSGAEGWSRALFTADDTDALSDDELHALRAEMSEAEYRQEMLCDWNAATPGAYYAKQLDEAERDGRIRDVPLDRALPVLTSWDFGIADPTVVVYWQLHGSEIRCLGADAIADLSLPELIAMVKNSRPYSWGRHFVPHDGARRSADEFGAPRRVEIMAEHGFPAEIAPTKSIDEGIEAVRRGLPRVVFDAKGCEILLEALRLYRSEYDDVRGVYKPKPVHDWTSHYADAVRTFFQATDGRSADAWGQSEFDLVDRELERSVI